MAISLTLIGATTLEPLTENAYGVLGVGVLSISIFFIWLSYEAHVRPKVKRSIERATEIECKLSALGYPVRMHHLIEEHDRILGNTNRGRLTYRALILLVIVAWVIRVVLAFHLIS